MANPAIARFSVLILLVSLFSLLVNNITVYAESLAPSPHFSSGAPSSSPSPSPIHVAPASNPSPTKSPNNAPTPAPFHPVSPPAPSSGNIPSPSPTPSPSPSPADVDDGGVNHTGVNDVDGKSSGGGMSSGKKAGIAVGVIAAAGVVTLGALVYRKRRQNLQRSQYGYAARRELL